MKRILLALATLVAGACSVATHPVVIDGHNDLLIHYVAPDGKSFQPIDTYAIAGETPGQVDLPRLKAGGVGAAIFTTAILDSSDREQAIRDSTGVLRELAAQHPDELGIATDAASLQTIMRRGRIAILMGLEGGDQLGESLTTLEAAHRHGVRAMTLVWNNSNAIGDSSSAAPKHGGLTPFGRDVIATMNRLGMLVDLSHASDATVRAALDVTRAPVIFSHSSARALCPAPRNLPDDLLRAVAANGGIDMVTFVPYFTTTEHWQWYERGEAEWARLQQLHGEDRAEVARGMEAWDAANPPPEVTVSDVADHIEHIRRTAGIDHVALGSDFDGMGSFRINGLEDASKFPALFDELKRRGWSRSELEKLASANFLRVLQAVERAAAAKDDA